MIAKEWDEEKNSFKPSDVTPRSDNCSFYYKTSAPEQAIYYYVKKAFPDAVNSYKPAFLEGMEIDVYIPKLKLGIEYEGSNWHSNLKKDHRKSILLKENGISLIRIKDKDHENLFDDFAVFRTKYVDKLKGIGDTIIDIFALINNTYKLGLSPDVNPERDATEIYALSEERKANKSLFASHDVVLSEWDYEKNGGLTPDKVTPSSHKQVWWKCSRCGKEWQQIVRTKVKGGLLCESCSKTDANITRAVDRIQSGVIQSVGDIPELRAEWNDHRDVNTVPKGSDYKAVWRCKECGNIFSMIVKNRTLQGQGCPKCSRDKSAKTRGKPVMNIDTGETYNSIAEARRMTGISDVCIRGCCNGKYKQAGGFRWSYIEKNQRTS